MTGDELKQIVKDAVAEGVQKVIMEALSVNEELDAAIDPWLVKWAQKPYSMALAVGFGIALLAIGAFVGKFLL